MGKSAHFMMRRAWSTGRPTRRLAQTPRLFLRNARSAARRTPTGRFRWSRISDRETFEPQNRAIHCSVLESQASHQLSDFEHSVGGIVDTLTARFQPGFRFL